MVATVTAKRCMTAELTTPNPDAPLRFGPGWVALLPIHIVIETDGDKTVGAISNLLLVAFFADHVQRVAGAGSTARCGRQGRAQIFPFPWG